MIKKLLRQRWMSAVLGVICAALATNIVMQFAGTGAGSPRPAENARTNQRLHGSAASSAAGKLPPSSNDPQVRLDLFKKFQARSLPKLARNPFEYGASPNKAPGSSSGTLPATVAAPPGPPPIPVKALGYSEGASGLQKAFVTKDERVYVVHEEEIFAKIFKVLRITPKFVEIEDESSHQTVELPFPAQ